MKRRLVAVVQAFSSADVCSVSFPGADRYRVLFIVVPVLRDVGGNSTSPHKVFVFLVSLSF
jgi:hypothetical protein